MTPALTDPAAVPIASGGNALNGSAALVDGQEAINEAARVKT